jgi:chromosome segregation ATPase
VGVIEMIAADIALMFCVIVLAIKMAEFEKRLDLANDDIEESIAEIKELKQRCDTHKKSIEYLSKSVRELNGVVEAAVNVKEETSDNKPDTKALIDGWSTDGTKTTWLDDILAKIRKEKEKPADTYYLGVGVDDDKMLRIPLRDTGQT